MLSAAAREARIDRALEAEDVDAFWEAHFPDLDWCDEILAQYGIHCAYSDFHKLAEEGTDQAWAILRSCCEKRDCLHAYAIEHDDIFEQDDRATVLTGLRFRRHYLAELYGWIDRYYEVFREPDADAFERRRY